MHREIARKVFIGPLCGLAVLAASCSRASAPDSPRAIAPSSSTAEAALAANDAPSDRPSKWFGARFENQRITVAVGERDAEPQPIVTEPPSHRAAGSLVVTDLAYDTQTQIVYVGTCCEPGSGQLLRVDATDPARGLLQGDQGFAVDVAGSPSVFARTDTWGTFVLRAQAGGKQDVREGMGVVDVAVDSSRTKRIIALIDSKRLQALIPTVPTPADPSRDPGLLVREWKTAGAQDIAYPLPKNAIYCRVIPLNDGAVGLLAGEWDRNDVMRCTGDTLDVYDTASKKRRTSVLRFPGQVQHLSIDASSRFLIFTTVDGAVGWKTLDGEGGSLANSGFVAADW